MGRGGRKKKKNVRRDDDPPVGSEVGSDGDGIVPPPRSVEAASGGDVTAGMASEEEERRDSLPERNGDVEKLKALVTETTEGRGQAAARIDEQSADVGAHAGVEGETNARGKTAALLEAADVGKHRALELLAVKDVEVAFASRSVAELEASVQDLSGKNTQLTAERSKLEKQLEEIASSARFVQAQKEEVVASFKAFKENTEMYKHDMEGKLKQNTMELQVLRSRKAEIENELNYLQAKNLELEAEVEASKIELAAAKREVNELRFDVLEPGKKYNSVVALVHRLSADINWIITMKEAAVSALTDENTNLKRESDELKIKFNLIQSNKDAVQGMVHEKDAEVTETRDVFYRLRYSINELRVLCEEQGANPSSLQHEKDTAVLKALGEEKGEAFQLGLRTGDLESCSSEKDREICELKEELEDKKGKIDGLNGMLEQLQLAVAEAQQSKKSGLWTWLCPATTTAIAAAFFAYATRKR